MADSADGRAQVDGAALEAVTEAMVALHERYHGRKPARARSHMLGDDMLACLLGDVYTDIEKTMIELQRKATVHETRRAFQQAMERRFIEVVERITRRRVAKFISTHHVGPDLELEIFLLEVEPGGTVGPLEGSRRGSGTRPGQRLLTFGSHRASRDRRAVSTPLPDP